MNKLIFGIYLGESLKSLNERKSVIHYLDYNNYNKKWKVIANHPSIIEISVLSYNRNIYEIQISFSDTSDNSYNIMKDELIKKYGPKTNVQFTEEVQGKEIDVDFFSKSIFKSNIDGIEVEIIINRDIGIFSDDTLTVTYIHKSLFNKLHIRNQEINMQKIQNEKNRTINISKEL